MRLRSFGAACRVPTLAGAFLLLGAAVSPTLACESERDRLSRMLSAHNIAMEAVRSIAAEGGARGAHRRRVCRVLRSAAGNERHMQRILANGQCRARDPEGVRALQTTLRTMAGEISEQSGRFGCRRA